MGETELKPCPFCGHEANIYYRGTRNGIVFYVQCDVCMAQTRVFRAYNEDTESDDFWDQLPVLKAIDAWNRRK